MIGPPNPYSMIRDVDSSFSARVSSFSSISLSLVFPFPFSYATDRTASILASWIPFLVAPTYWEEAPEFRLNLRPPERIP